MIWREEMKSILFMDDIIVYMGIWEIPKDQQNKSQNVIQVSRN